MRSTRTLNDVHATRNGANLASWRRAADKSSDRGRPARSFPRNKPSLSRQERGGAARSHVQIVGIGAQPILQFSAEKPFAINKSAVCNPTGLKRAYTHLVSCREAEVDNSVQFKRCDLSVMRQSSVRKDAAVSRRENETRKVQLGLLWLSCTSIGNED